MVKAKPFIKWVGGKRQLIGQLEAHLPADFGKWNDATYIEPFVGGGAMLYYMLQRYPNIGRAVINDINSDLMTCYHTVRNSPEKLIASLHEIQNAYNGLRTEEARKDFYLQARARYNGKNLDCMENTVLFIFLNRTCFNGLYRVNKKGLFNVPFGRSEKAQLCDEDTIMADSELLQRVEIMTGDFEATINRAQGHTLFYLDPPYRPLCGTSNFNDYAKQAFNDDAQIRLKHFCDRISSAGHKFMLSNSDGRGRNVHDIFFDRLYEDYQIERVWAARCVNSDASKRGKITEILVRNYKDTQAITSDEDAKLEISPVLVACGRESARSGRA